MPDAFAPRFDKIRRKVPVDWSAEVSPIPTAYVVDDEPGIRRLFCAALAAAGLETVAFAGIRDLVRRRPRPPDLAVVDYTMPGARGDVVIRRCREELGWHRTRFCLVTGSIELVPDLAGAVDLVLQKPVNLGQFVSQCLRLVQAAPPAGTTPQASTPRERAVAR